MNMKAIAIVLLALLMAGLALIMPTASSTIQVFPSELGKFQIDLPLVLTLDTSTNTPTHLDLSVTTDTPLPSGRPYPGMIPVVGINFINLADWGGVSSHDYVFDYWGPCSDTDHQCPMSEMQTNDGHKMWFFTEISKGKISKYYAFIDYSELNYVIEIHALRSVYYGKQIALFEPVEFQKICKSFAIEEMR